MNIKSEPTAPVIPPLRNGDQETTRKFAEDIQICKQYVSSTDKIDIFLASLVSTLPFCYYSLSQIEY